jgi:hypothetical protein
MNSSKWMNPHLVGVTTRAGDIGGSSGEYLAGVFGVGEGTGEQVEPVEYIFGANVVLSGTRWLTALSAIHR